MQKQRMNHLLLRARVVVRNFTMWFGRLRQRNALVQHDYSSSFGQPHHSIVALFFVLAGAVSSSPHRLMFKALQPHLARQNVPARGQRGSNLAKILGLLIGVCLFVGCVSGAQVSFATRKES